MTNKANSGGREMAIKEGNPKQSQLRSNAKRTHFILSEGKTAHDERFLGCNPFVSVKSRSIMSGSCSGVRVRVGAIAAERPLVDAMICRLRASLRSTQ